MRIIGADVLGGEVRAEHAANLMRFGQVRVESQQAREQPVAVHARVPVEAAVEGRVERARRLNVARVVQNMLDLVRVLLTDAPQRQPREVRRLLAAQRQLAVRRARPHLRMKSARRHSQQHKR